LSIYTPLLHSSMVPNIRIASTVPYFSVTKRVSYSGYVWC